MFINMIVKEVKTEAEVNVKAIEEQCKIDLAHAEALYAAGDITTVKYCTMKVAAVRYLHLTY